ncbi:hypothetical protein HYQ44_003592 [Verticillium longisporum]|nr:hypothetical protein HYQ44_003592 [Verticillium longisporum]
MVRRKPWAERVKAMLNPMDFLLWVSEELETRDWDSKALGTKLGLAFNFIFLIARANCAASEAHDDVFSDGVSSRLTNYVIRPLSWILVLLSGANAFYTVTRSRHYRLFEVNVEQAPQTPSAHRVKVQSSPVASSPLRFLSNLIVPETAESRAHPDKTRDVWELAVWDPLPVSLQLFSLFSPGHVLVYMLFLPLENLDPRPSVTVFNCLALQVILSVQMLLLQSRFSHPNPNYMRHVDPEHTPARPHRNVQHSAVASRLFTPSSQARRSGSFTPVPSTRSPSRQSLPAGVSAAATPSASTTKGTQYGGNLGVFSHAKSPLKKASSLYDLSTDYASPRNSREMAALEQRRASPVKDNRRLTTANDGDEAPINPFAQTQKNRFSQERYPKMWALCSLYESATNASNLAVTVIIVIIIMAAVFDRVRRILPSNRPEKGGTLRVPTPIPRIAHSSDQLTSWNTAKELPTIPSPPAPVTDAQRRKEQRRQLRESGDYLGVQGINPSTGELDTMTSSSGSQASYLDEELRQKLLAVKRRGSRALRAHRKPVNGLTPDDHASILQRERQKLLNAGSSSTDVLRARKSVRWRRDPGQWSSVIEPDLSPISGSRQGSTTDLVPKLGPSGEVLETRRDADHSSDTVIHTPARRRSSVFPVDIAPIPQGLRVDDDNEPEERSGSRVNFVDAHTAVIPPDFQRPRQRSLPLQLSSHESPQPSLQSPMEELTPVRGAIKDDSRVCLHTHHHHYWLRQEEDELPSRVDTEYIAELREPLHRNTYSRGYVSPFAECHASMKPGAVYVSTATQTDMNEVLERKRRHRVSFRR